MMRKLTSFIKALIMSVLIPYFWTLVIASILFSSNLSRKVEAYQSLKIVIFSFIKESVTILFFGFNIWIISVAVFVIWLLKIYIPYRKE